MEKWPSVQMKYNLPSRSVRVRISGEVGKREAAFRFAWSEIVHISGALSYPASTHFCCVDVHVNS